MSVITLSIGQCGIQVAQDLFTTLYDDINTKPPPSSKDYTNDATKRWFTISKRGLWSPRSILIDTDNKTLPADNKRFKFNSVLSHYGGCGNNWANGFCRKSKLFMGQIEEQLRKVFESDGEVANILSLFSSGGGTGSGVGARVLQRVHDCFPEKRVMSVLVLPYNAGEVAVQAYNTVLTLSKLYDVADGVFLFENDRLQAFCKRSYSNVGYQHLNALISKQLAVALQPTKELSVNDLIDKLNVSNSRKLIQLRGGLIGAEENRPYESAATWSALMKEIARGNCAKFQTIADVLISRGTDQPKTEEIKLFASTILQHYHQSRPFKSENRNLVLLSNNSSVEFVLNSVVAEAWKLFTHGAYLHHYLKYGIDEMYFLRGFEKLETILYDYKNLY